MLDQVTLEGRPLAIFPCRAKKPVCMGGCHAAVSDPVAIADLFRRYPNAHQIGVATGEINDLDILDIDPRNGGNKFWEENRHRFPVTRTHQTPSGGHHLLFRHAPGLRCSSGRIAKGIDVKADGGFIIWWPAQFYPVQEAPVADWPEWLLGMAMAAMRPRDRAIAKNGGNGALGIWSISQADWKVSESLYRKMTALIPRDTSLHNWRRVRGLLRTLVQLNHEGDHRNQALNNIAFNFRELINSGVVTYSAAEQLLLEASRLNGYLAKDGIGEVMATIGSGLGLQTPSAPSPHKEEENNAP
jgi:hypothetical protein